MTDIDFQDLDILSLNLLLPEVGVLGFDSSVGVLASLGLDTLMKTSPSEEEEESASMNDDDFFLLATGFAFPAPSFEKSSVTSSSSSVLRLSSYEFFEDARLLVRSVRDDVEDLRLEDWLGRK